MLIFLYSDFMYSICIKSYKWVVRWVCVAMWWNNRPMRGGECVGVECVVRVWVGCVNLVFF